MDNNSFSTLEVGMKASTQNKTNITTGSINYNVQNTYAEDILAKVASILFWVSTIGYGSTAITGFVMLIKNSLITEYSNERFAPIGLIIIIASIILYLVNIIAWAKLKVNINISRNLFVIKGLMLEDREKNSSIEEKQDEM